MKLFIRTRYSIEEFYDIQSSGAQKSPEYTRVKFMKNNNTVHYIELLNSDAMTLIEDIAKTIHCGGSQFEHRTAIVFDATKFLTYRESDDKSIMVM